MALVTEKSLFIHVPKTGGTFVRRALPALGLPCRESGIFAIEDHFSIAQVFATHPGLDDGRRLTFGFVRHPVAWIKSRWAWAMISGFAAKTFTDPAAAAHWMATCWSKRITDAGKLLCDTV